jgi:hypothetical protein
MAFQQPSFATPFDDLCDHIIWGHKHLPWSCQEYLSSVFFGEIQETYLDPIIHFFLLDHLDLSTKYPDIFPRKILPMEWHYYLPPSKPATALEAFEKPSQSEYVLANWTRWSESPTYTDLISSLGMNDISHWYQDIEEGTAQPGKEIP